FSAAVEQIYCFEMLARFRLHRTNHRQAVGDARALRHKLAEMHARQLRGDAAEWTAIDAVRFRVPRFELAGCAAEPEQDAMLLFALGLFGQGLQRKESVPAQHRSDTSPSQALQKHAAMQAMFWWGASSGSDVGSLCHFSGSIGIQRWPAKPIEAVLHPV